MNSQEGVLFFLPADLGFQKPLDISVTQRIYYRMYKACIYLVYKKAFREERAPVREKKKDRAYAAIRTRVLQRSPSDSFVISENSLAVELNMSRTPIREALQRLQMEGFIEIHPQRGIVIPEVSVIEVNETFALRMAIEEFVIKEVIPFMTEQRMAEMDRNLALQREAVNKGDVPEYLRHDKEFHDHFLRIYSNALIFKTAQRVRDRFISMGANVLREPGSVERSFAEHCSIADAVRRGDRGAAAEAMHRHLVTGRSNILSMPGNLGSGI